MQPMEKYLSESLSRSWWLLLVRGLVAIAFSIMVFMRPEASLAALLLVFGAFILADGVFGSVLAIASRKDNDSWWVLLLWGLAGIVIGVMALMAPNAVLMVLVLYVAAWTMVTGVLQIVAAVRLRNEIRGEWLLALGGALSFVFAILLIARPDIAILTLLWLLAGYTLLWGVLLVIFAFKARRFTKRLTA